MAFGIAVLYGDYATWDEGHRAFARDSGAFNLWLGLMCAQTAVWAIGSTAVILVLIVALAVGGPRRTHWPEYVQNHCVATSRCRRSSHCRLAAVLELDVGLVGRSRRAWRS